MRDTGFEREGRGELHEDDKPKQKRAPASVPVTIMDGLKMLYGLKKTKEWQEKLEDKKRELAKSLPPGTSAKFKVYYHKQDHRYIEIVKLNEDPIRAGDVELCDTVTVTSSQPAPPARTEPREPRDHRDADGHEGGGGGGGGGGGRGHNSGPMEARQHEALE
ncbi:MAG: hypothetical protein Tsb0020_15930 [Haliangiales bacterium]